MDAEGCYYRTCEAEAFLPGFDVQVVDTVGAGDGFMAALLVQLLAAYSKLDNFEAILEDKNWLAEICRYANAAGAFTTTRAGAIPALPTRRQINRFLTQNLLPYTFIGRPKGAE
jgi:sugar/nucleoside kinase (ribokinase family)